MSQDILSMYLKGSNLKHLSVETRALLAEIYYEIYTEHTRNPGMSGADALHVMSEVIRTSQPKGSV